jgi:hypothetical protein
MTLVTHNNPSRNTVRNRKIEQLIADDTWTLAEGETDTGHIFFSGSRKW